MLNTICLVLSLTLVSYWAETSPVGLGTLEFDNLDADIANLSYEVEEEDLDDFSKLLDEADETAKSDNAANSKDKTSVKTSEFNKKKTANKGSKRNRNIQDVKKFYKGAGEHDQGSYDDDDEYIAAEGEAAQAVGIKGKEQRTYRKGTKTRGFHRVHHKDEYKKNKVFYEDDETKGSLNKVGAKGLGFRIGTGKGLSKGHFHHDRQKGTYGKRGYEDRGYSEKDFMGYSDLQGFDGAFSSDT